MAGDFVRVTYGGVAYNAALFVSAGTGTLAAAALATATAGDLRSYGSADLQVHGLSGGDTITVTRSLNGTDYVTQTVIGNDYGTATSITADGIYSVPGRGYIKWAQTGSASTPTVTLAGY